VAIIAYLSFIPLDHLKLPKALSLDKIFHLGVYAVLVLLFAFPLKPFSREFYWSIGFTIFFGLGIEFVQHYLIPNRTGDVFDVLANLLGVAIGVLLLKRLKIT
jgi:VanZ family protein